MRALASIIHDMIIIKGYPYGDLYFVKFIGYAMKEL